GREKIKVFCTGEALTEDLAEQLVARSDEVWNLYGPTETTIFSTTGKMVRGESGVTVGKPVANTQIYILGKKLEVLPVGAVGDLYIAGAGLARGYLNQADLTAERFLPNPFSRWDGERMYETGDLARYREDGRIEILGRADHQVKI